jgi:hypothetical protein
VTDIFELGSDATDLEGATDFVESVAVVAHDLAGTGDITEFVGQLQQRQLAFGTLGQSGHGDLLVASWLCGNSNLPEDPAAALPSACGRESNPRLSSESPHWGLPE